MRFPYDVLCLHWERSLTPTSNRDLYTVGASLADAHHSKTKTIRRSFVGAYCHTPAAGRVPRRGSTKPPATDATKNDPKIVRRGVLPYARSGRVPRRGSTEPPATDAIKKRPEGRCRAGSGSAERSGASRVKLKRPEGRCRAGSGTCTLIGCSNPH